MDDSASYSYLRMGNIYRIFIHHHLQILVHDPKVRPRVYELGSGLEPGTEVFVVIKKNEVGIWITP